jgi:transposase
MPQVGRPVIVLGNRRRTKLEKLVARATAPQRLVQRAKIVLLAWRGRSDAEIAAEVGVCVGTVRTWIARYSSGGLPALADRPRSGRPEVYGPTVRVRIIATATSSPPAGESQWNHRMLAAELADTGISPAQVGRVLAAADLRPHRVRGWLARRDDEAFWEQAAAVCDRYLAPPADTVLISIDEKTGIQAKSRKYPEQSMAQGRPARREFEYVRHGTVSIIAAMEVATGQVWAERIRRNDSATFIVFLRRLEQAIDPKLKIHLVLDNGSSHTSKATKAWLQAHPRFSVTYTPKHASWLNMVELWFSVLTRRLLRRGDFSSREDLENKITEFTVRYNTTAKPFAWKYDARAEHARYLARRQREQAHQDTYLQAA